MDCTITSFASKKARAMTLVETMLASAITGLVVIGATSLAFFATRSFAAMTNYVDLDAKSRNALDQMTTEIRQADVVTAASDTGLTFQTTDPDTHAIHTLQYIYSPTDKTLTRIFDGEQKVLLTRCTFYTDSLCQRNTTNATFGNAFQAIPTGRLDECKVIQLTWVCSRNILSRTANTESVQSAHVVIRKK